MSENSTIEVWARSYIESTSLSHKLGPPPPPERFEEEGAPLFLGSPGRPPELRPLPRGARLPRVRGLGSAEKRAALLHTFAHHELQAAELMCWAILAYPQAPVALRRGLLRVALDEVRHLGLYEAELRRLGARYGAHPVRDWFWERIPSPELPLSAFLGLLGVGFEGANLDHAARFTRIFRQVGDEQAALVQEQVGREEEAHVRFAALWIGRLEGELSFDRWCASLPAPLTPLVLRGEPLAREARLRAGLSEAFLERLSSWTASEGSP